MNVIGVDEVGRGAWAGPVCVGAVQLLSPLDGLKDSKLLSPARRLTLAYAIRKHARVGLGWASAGEIDAHGLTKALGLAMERALSYFESTLLIVLDGTFNYLPERSNIELMAKADALVPAVSAASIVAKVARDNLMARMSIRFPDYGFEKHVGYGTAHHSRQLAKNGACPYHRQSFTPVAQLVML